MVYRGSTLERSPWSAVILLSPRIFPDSLVAIGLQKLLRMVRKIVLVEGKRRRSFHLRQPIELLEYDGMSLDGGFVDDGPNATSRFNVPKETQEGGLTSLAMVEPRLNGVSECSSTILFTVSRNLRADSRPDTWSMQTRHSHGLKTSPTSKDGECDPSALTFFVTVIRDLVGLMILVLASCDHVSMSPRVRHAPLANPV